MKKLFALLLGAAMALSLAACGGKTGAGRDDASPAGTPTPAQTAAPQVTEPPAPASTFQSTIEPTVLVDEQGVKITAAGLRYTGYAAELDLTIENNSDKDLSFYSGTLGYGRNSVNGYMVDSLYVNASVPAGKKANETASIGLEDLAFYGITDIADLELAFDINDSDYNDYLQTEPAPIRTSLAGGYDYAADTYQKAMSDGAVIEAMSGTLDHFAADELYNEQGVRAVSETFLTNSGGEQAVLIELENTSDRMVTVRTGDICLNGLQVQSGRWSGDDINAGKRRVIALQPYDLLDPAYWEPYGLDRVGEVSFALTLEDADGNVLSDGVPLTLAMPGASAAYRSEGETVYSGGGVQILNMGIVPDAAGERFGLHLLLLAENGTAGPVQFDVGYDTLSVNGYMTDFFCMGPTLAPGQSGVFDVEMDGDSLAENGVASAADIAALELTLELHDGYYNELAAPTVTIGEGGQSAEQAAAAGDGTEADAGAGISAGVVDGTADIPGVSPEFKEVMNSYEAFFDEYAAFMQNYQSAGSSTSMLMDYLSFLTRYTEAMQKLDEIDTSTLSNADLAYYTQVMARISAKLAGAMG